MHATDNRFGTCMPESGHTAWSTALAACGCVNAAELPYSVGSAGAAFLHAAAQAAVSRALLGLPHHARACQTKPDSQTAFPTNRNTHATRFRSSSAHAPQKIQKLPRSPRCRARMRWCSSAARGTQQGGGGAGWCAHAHADWREAEGVFGPPRVLGFSIKRAPARAQVLATAFDRVVLNNNERARGPSADLGLRWRCASDAAVKASLGWASPEMLRRALAQARGGCSVGVAGTSERTSERARARAPCATHRRRNVPTSARTRHDAYTACRRRAHCAASSSDAG
jgi:hypothetical protein